MVLRPYGPTIAVLCEVPRGRTVTVFGPAHDIVDRVDSCWRRSLPRRRTPGMAERSKIEKHHNLAARHACQRKSMANKLVGEAEPVGWIRNDVHCASCVFVEEVDTAFAETVVIQVRADHGLPVV